MQSARCISLTTQMIHIYLQFPQMRSLRISKMSKHKIWKYSLKMMFIKIHVQLKCIFPTTRKILLQISLPSISKMPKEQTGKHSYRNTAHKKFKSTCEIAAVRSASGGSSSPISHGPSFAGISSALAVSPRGRADRIGSNRAGS